MKNVIEKVDQYLSNGNFKTSKGSGDDNSVEITDTSLVDQNNANRSFR